MGEPSRDHEDEHVDGDDVDEKHIASPGAHHVEVSHRAEGSPVDVASLDTLDPEIVGEQHAEYGDALVVVAPRHGPADVSRHDGDHTGGGEAGTHTVEFRGQEVGDDGREGGEEGGEEHADLPHINGHVESVKDVEDGAGRNHQSGVNGASDNAAQRIPGSVIKPVVEIVESSFS